MSNMSRGEVLDCMVGGNDGYPDDSDGRSALKAGYSGWRWLRVATGEDDLGREWHLYREDGSAGTITPRDYEAHKARQQGDPNAHDWARKDVSEWDGVGLPPVGAVVEVFDAGYGVAYGEELIGESAEVKAWVRQERCDVAVLDYEGGLYCFRSEMLRPARSEEDKAVEEMVVVLCEASGWNDMHERNCRALYRAGYRKEGV